MSSVLMGSVCSVVDLKIVSQSQVRNCQRNRTMIFDSPEIDGMMNVDLDNLRPTVSEHHRRSRVLSNSSTRVRLAVRPEKAIFLLLC